ncbi:MAG: hypothetical protein K0S53_2690 [Bacteroidetes bacterium]|jgi:hypothetical protein|nr:hypothetical protein [Bacteroidota bacterium]
MREIMEQYTHVMDDPYDFDALKSKIKQYPTYEEKLNCLMEVSVF